MVMLIGSLRATVKTKQVTQRSIMKIKLLSLPHKILHAKVKVCDW